MLILVYVVHFFYHPFFINLIKQKIILIIGESMILIDKLNSSRYNQIVLLLTKTPPEWSFTSKQRADTT